MRATPMSDPPLSRLVAIVVGLALACAYEAAAQWIPANAPRGPIISLFADDGKSLFSSTNNYGVIQSRDRGDSWHYLGFGPAGCCSDRPNALIARGDTVYLGGDRGVRIHPGAVGAWRYANAGLGADTVIRALAFGWGGILAVDSGGKIYQSLDQGANWKRLNPGAQTWYVNWQSPAVALDGDCGFMSGLGGVWRSLDRGRTWAPSLPAPDDSVVGMVACKPPYVFAMTANALYRSRDSAATWRKLDLRASDSGGFLSFDIVGGRLYADEYEDGLYVSDDDGDSWSRDRAFFNGRGLFMQGGMRALGPELFAGTAAGIYRSSDQGRTWTAANTGIASFEAGGLVPAGRGRVAMLANREVYVTGDSGRHWESLAIPGRNAESIGGVGGHLFAVDPYAGLYLSRNAGRSWELYLEADPAQTFSGRFYGLGDELYFATPGAEGPVFTVLDPDRSGKRPLPAWKGGMPKAMTLCGGVAFAIVSDTLLLYDPQRKEWRPTASAPSRDILSLGSQGSALLAGAWEDGLFRSADSGRTWTRLLEPAENVGINVLLEAGEYAFAGSDSGVYFSRGGGPWKLLEWGLDSLPPSGRRVSHLLIQDGFLFAGMGWMGIWRFPLDGIGTGIVNRPGAPARKAAKWTRVAGGIGFNPGPGRPFYDANGKAIRPSPARPR